MTQDVATLTVDQVAKMLKVARATAYAAVRTGQIPSCRVGRRILIPRAALEKLLTGSGAPQGKTDDARSDGRS